MFSIANRTTDAQAGAAESGPFAALAARTPFSHETVSLVGWLLTILAAEIAVHGVGEPIYGVMLPFLTLTAVIALLTGKRFGRTGYPHWLLAAFAGTLITLDGFLATYIGLGVSLHDIHGVTDVAALGTAFFLLVESRTPGAGGSRTASLLGGLSCCGFLLVIPAFFLGSASSELGAFLDLINSESMSTVLALPRWLPFLGLIPAVVALFLGDLKLRYGKAAAPAC